MGGKLSGWRETGCKGSWELLGKCLMQIDLGFVKRGLVGLDGGKW